MHEALQSMQAGAQQHHLGANAPYMLTSVGGNGGCAGTFPIQASLAEAAAYSDATRGLVLSNGGHSNGEVDGLSFTTSPSGLRPSFSMGTCGGGYGAGGHIGSVPPPFALGHGDWQNGWTGASANYHQVGAVPTPLPAAGELQCGLSAIQSDGSHGQRHHCCSRLSQGGHHGGERPQSAASAPRHGLRTGRAGGVLRTPSYVALGASMPAGGSGAGGRPGSSTLSNGSRPSRSADIAVSLTLPRVAAEGAMAPKDGRGYLVPASLLTPTDAPVFRWDAGWAEPTSTSGRLDASNAYHIRPGLDSAQAKSNGFGGGLHGTSTPSCAGTHSSVSSLHDAYGGRYPSASNPSSGSIESRTLSSLAPSASAPLLPWRPPDESAMRRPEDLRAAADAAAHHAAAAAAAASSAASAAAALAANVPMAGAVGGLPWPVEATTPVRRPPLP